MSANCPKCGQTVSGETARVNHIAAYRKFLCGTIQGIDNKGDIGQTVECIRAERSLAKDAQLAALTQRVEQVERERDTVVESQTFILKSVEEIAAARAAAEAEVKRLREGIESTIRYVLTGVHCRYVDHQYNDCCDCGNITGEFEKLLAQPSDGKEAEDERT